MIWRFVIGAVELGVESPLESGDRNLFLLFFIVAKHKYKIYHLLPVLRLPAINFNYNLIVFLNNNL